MRTVSVNVQVDYLQRLTKVKKPIIAIAELVWNALDADASRVDVSFHTSLLGVTDSIRVNDNGHGIPHKLAIQSFERLGGSWKQGASRSHEGRLLHGRAGKGRFRAFSLGARVEWKTVTKNEQGQVVAYSVRGALDHLKEFTITDPVPTDEPLGTEVVITESLAERKSIRGVAAAQALAEEFAIYLRQYKSASIRYDGLPVDPENLERARFEYPLGIVRLPDGPDVSPTLLVIEWRMETERAIFLCDGEGFALDRAPVNIQAPGYHFSAYLRDPHIRQLEKQGLLEMGDLNPQVAPMLEAARAKLRDHFRHRMASAATELVEEWKKQEIYPYSDPPRSILEEAKRQVFDVVALNVHNYMPEFRASELKSQRLSLRLLAEALEDSPAAVRRILSEVLELPLEKQNELAALLDRTTLSAIIASSKLVADRLDFLKGLEHLVFDHEMKSLVLERRQLHRILENHTWLFGEEFNLTVSDQSLTEVLNKHLHKLRGRAATRESRPVLREGDKEGIVDLMLSRTVPQPRADLHEHLIIELKRPNKKIDASVFTQINSYALAVQKDERFTDTNTRWVFWAVSNEITEDVRLLASQKNRPVGLAVDTDGRIQVWLKTWAQVFDGARARLRFFQKALEYEASDESALAYLRSVHAAHLPQELLEVPATDGLKLEPPSPRASARGRKAAKKTARKAQVPPSRRT